MVAMITVGVLLVYSGFLTRNTNYEIIGITTFITGGILLLIGATGHGLFGRRHFW